MITNQTWPGLPAFATVRRKGAVNPAAAEAVRGFLAFYTQWPSPPVRRGKIRGCWECLGVRTCQPGRERGCLSFEPVMRSSEAGGQSEGLPSSGPMCGRGAGLGGAQGSLVVASESTGVQQMAGPDTAEDGRVATKHGCDPSLTPGTPTSPSRVALQPAPLTVLSVVPR